MSRLVVSPRARADLGEIWDYTARRWGDAQAERYIRLLQAAMEEIARRPRKGSPCDDIRPGYRKYPAGSHLLFYRRIGRSVDVVRILHNRMDFERHL